MKIAVLYEEIGPDAPADMVDTLVQARAVSEAVARCGYTPVEITFSPDIGKTLQALRTQKPDVVFNLVESVLGVSRLMHFAPSLLEVENIPFTGIKTMPLLSTTDKLFSKRFLNLCEIATPQWMVLSRDLKPLTFDPPVILKPHSEDASTGIHDTSLCFTAQEFLEKVGQIPAAKREEYFAEEYIEGREFNVSLLGKRDGVEIFPIAEMCFVDFPPGKPHIVNYKAKWDASSFEFHNTVRRFDFQPEDQPLLERIREISLRCWHAFGLTGYARVDLRSDRHGQPWTLEINGNPCISPDSGFVAAANAAGVSFDSLIAMVIDEARFRHGR